MQLPFIGLASQFQIMIEECAHIIPPKILGDLLILEVLNVEQSLKFVFHS